MKQPVIRFSSTRQAQRGLSLIELLVAVTISIIAVSAMLIVMANTLGTGSQTIQMSRLSQEMRTSLSIMSREVRRANYHANFLSCYGNAGCRSDLGITGVVKEVSITDAGDTDCFWFWYDRPQSGTEVAVTGETVAAFRRVVDGTVGKLQMTTTETAAPSCGASASDAQWVDITDTDVVDIQTFNISDANSFTEAINSDGDTQLVERLTISITGRVVQSAALATWLQAPALETKTLDHFVQVRNNVTTAAP